MVYAVCATLAAKEGEEEAIRRILELMTPPSRAEPGCLQYQAHRSTAEPRVFFIYEQYVDEAGYRAHQATPHYIEHITGDATSRMDSRHREFYETLG